MPGIVGIISKKSPDESQRLIASMVGSMEHEKFYVSGNYSVPEMGIYGGWVSHENSFAAGQVFFNEQKDIALIFSGESFVPPEACASLKQKGHQLGTSEAGWLVHVYEEEGEQFFEKLNGLFSGLLIDKRRRRAFLFNDRYGMERIYWHETKDATYFASEAKALLRVLPELRAFDEGGVSQFLTYGCTLEWKTLFQGVGLLPGGSLWTFENGKCDKKRYFTPANWESQATLTVEAFESKFQETFKRILPRYVESGSRIGISLTGGLDTRMIMACLPKSSHKPVCYTFAGIKGETLDVRLAAQVARALDLEHRTLRIGPDFFSNYCSYADRTVYITDGCFGVSGAHEIYLHEQARRLSPIRVTGNFGSEVLRSMSTFKPIGLSADLFNSEFKPSLNSSAKRLSEDKDHPVSFAAFKEIPWNLFGSLAAGRSQVTFRTPYLDNEIVGLAFQAPQSVRQSPLSALHLVKSNNPVLSRIPTDRGLVGDARGMSGAARRIYSEVTFKLDYLYNEGLPHWLSPLDPLLECFNSGNILGLHKYLPFRRWFRSELASCISERLMDAQTLRMSYWNPDFLGRLAGEHINGHRNYVREINAVLTLEAVQRLMIGGLPQAGGPQPKQHSTQAV